MPEPGSFELLFVGIAVLVVLIPFWRIFAKAGFHGALSILILVPIVNIVMFFFLAFADWPALQKKPDTLQP